MAGTLYKRCTVCGRKVLDRACTKPGCDGSGFTWAFSVSLGVRPDGSRRRVMRSGFDTKRAAEAALDEVRANSAKSLVAPRSLTLERYLIDRWLPRLRTSEKTRRDREIHMTIYVIPRIGHVRLIDVTGDMITEMYTDLLADGRTTKSDPVLGRGLSPTTVRRIHAHLRKAFNDAIRWELLLRNPCAQSDPPSMKEVRARALAARQVYSWEQLSRFLDEASTHRLHAMWHILASTGMRRAEVAALQWDYVDLSNSMLSVVRSAVDSQGEVHEHELPKSSASRRSIELFGRDVDLLISHQKSQERDRAKLGEGWRDTNHVFTSHVGGRLYPPDITRWFHQLTKRAGLPRIRLHDLRHTNATLLIKAGVPVKVVTERLGHSSTAYTQDAYQHVIPGMQRDAAQIFHTLLEAAAENQEDQ